MYNINSPKTFYIKYNKIIRVSHGQLTSYNKLMKFTILDMNRVWISFVNLNNNDDDDDDDEEFTLLGIV